MVYRIVLVAILVVTCCCMIQSFQLTVTTTTSQHRQHYSTTILFHETTRATRSNNVQLSRTRTSTLYERKASNTDMSPLLSKSTSNLKSNNDEHQLIHSIRKITVSTIVGLSILTGGLFTQHNPYMIANAASDPTAIVGCLFQKCSIQLGKCIASPLCLANVICINTCNNRPDEIECQIKCGDIFDNNAIAEFNKCAVSDMSCVPQQPDDGSYPIPSKDMTVSKFNTNFFNGRLYITAETEPGKFFGQLNWRVTEPDGEYFTRDALQEFYQDPYDPSHLINHDNEYLHYKDDWWIIDYEYDNNEKGIPPFAFVYYRGSNDAWDGYGGVVVYTRDAALPMELLPRLRDAAKKVNFDFDKDFTITDNSCPAELSDGEKVLLREKFAGKAILQTEQQLQAAATRFRGNAVNSIKAQKLFFDNRSEKASEAYATLEQSKKDFETEIKGSTSTTKPTPAAAAATEAAPATVEGNSN